MTLAIHCPHCQQPLASENINIATDLAKCVQCGSINKVSSLLFEQDEQYLSSPPKGATIQLSTTPGGSVNLFFPKKGFTLSHLPQLLFVVLGLCFVSYWTFGAAQGVGFFALFSIPFWLSSAGMLIGLTNTVFETQTIILSKGQLLIEKARPIGSKNIRFELRDIQESKSMFMTFGPFLAITNPRFIWRIQWSNNRGIFLPAILTGSGTTYFFEEANEAERKWVTKYLNHKISLAKQ